VSAASSKIRKALLPLVPARKLIWGSGRQGGRALPGASKPAQKGGLPLAQRGCQVINSMTMRMTDRYCRTKNYRARLVKEKKVRRRLMMIAGPSAAIGTRSAYAQRTRFHSSKKASKNGGRAVCGSSKNARANQKRWPKNWECGVVPGNQSKLCRQHSSTGRQSAGSAQWALFS